MLSRNEKWTDAGICPKGSGGLLAVPSRLPVEAIDFFLKELRMIADENVLYFDIALFEAVAIFETAIRIALVFAIVDLASFADIECFERDPERGKG